MATIFERTRKIIAEKLGVDEEEVVPEASFTEDLNADSLDLVELTMAVEEEFGNPDKPLEIPDEEVEKLTTVKKLVDYLEEQGIEDK